MSRLIQAGWESGDVAQIGAVSGFTQGGTAPSAPTVVSATPTARSGTYSIKATMNQPTSANGQDEWSRLTISHTSQTELWYAFGIYRSNSTELTSSLPQNIMFENFDSAGNVNFVASAEADGTVRLYFANTGAGNPNAVGSFTLIGASSVTIPLTTWTLIELHFIAATGATGTAEIYVGGTLGFSSTATRTCQTNANTTSFALQIKRLASFSQPTVSYFAFDDLRVNTTAGSVNNGRPHDASVVLIKPSGAGNHTGLTGTGGATNWQDVSNIPPNHSDFVSGSAGAYDTYATSGAPTVSTVEALEYIAQAQGGANIEPTFFTQSTLNTQTAQATQASWGYITQILETNPVSSAAWTQSDLSNLQLGVTCP